MVPRDGMKSDLQAKMKVRQKLGVVDVNSLRGVQAGPRRLDVLGPASVNESAQNVAREHL